jgi:hypothetical protein
VLNTVPAASAPYLDNIPAQVDPLVIALSQRNHDRLEGLRSRPEIGGRVSDLCRGSDISAVCEQAKSVIIRYVPGT